VTQLANKSEVQLSITVLTNMSLPYLNLSMKRLTLTGQSYKSKCTAQIKFSFTSSSLEKMLNNPQMNTLKKCGHPLALNMV
jgi:hypothetical protein